MSERRAPGPLDATERAQLRATLAALVDPGAAAELVHGRTGAPAGPMAELVQRIARDALARIDSATPRHEQLDNPSAEQLDDASPDATIPEPRPAPDEHETRSPLAQA